MTVETIVTVNPLSTSKLRAIADKFMVDAVKDYSPVQTLSVKALFVMPEEVVSAQWTALAERAVGDKHPEVLTELYRVNSPFTQSLIARIKEQNALDQLRREQKAERERLEEFQHYQQSQTGSGQSP